MSENNVYILDFLDDDLQPESQILDGCAQVAAFNAHSEADLVGRIEDADAVMLYHFIGLSASTIARMDRCKLIVRCGVGFDNVDLQAARERGIPVANIPEYGA